MVAVDIGGTKLEAGLVGPDGAVLARARTSTRSDGAAGALWDDLRRLIDTVVGDRSPVACGVGCGGPMTPGGETVSPLNIPAWRDFPLRSRLSGELGVPVFVDNDAKALARAEGWLGAARGEPDYLAMVVSTGVGGGVVVDGRLLHAAHGNAGHIGHVTVEPDGRPCACGARGCLEAEASGTAIAALTGGPAAEAPAEIRRRAGRLVGRAVAGAAALCGITLAVVAGSVALGYGEDFFAAARQEAARRTGLGFTRGLRIEPAGLGSDGPLLGAAAVALSALGHPAGPR